MGKEIHLYLPLRWAAKDTKKKIRDADPLQSKMTEYFKKGYKFEGGWDSKEKKLVVYKNPTTNHRVEIMWDKLAKKLSVKDSKDAFEESKHPRSNNGQFGSGGGNKSDREVKMSSATVKSVSAGLKKNLQAAQSEKVTPAQRAAAITAAKKNLEKHISGKDTKPTFQAKVMLSGPDKLGRVGRNFSVTGYAHMAQTPAEAIAEIKKNVDPYPTGARVVSITQVVPFKGY